MELLRKLSFLLITVLSISACIGKHNQQPIRIGTNVWTGYEPLYVARTLKYYSPDEIRLVEYVSATQVMRSLRDGAIEMGALTLDEALLLEQQGVDIRVVLVMDYSAGADALITKPHIKKLADLRGQTIGVETTALGAYVMHRALQKAKLKLTDVKVKSVEHAQHTQAFESGAVDAIVTFDPIRSQLLEYGARTLFDTTDIEGEVVDVLVVKADIAKQRSEAISRLLSSWFRAVKYTHDNPDRSSSLMMPRLKLSKEGVQQALAAIKLPDRAENKTLLQGNPSRLQVQASSLAKVMSENGLLPGVTRQTSLFDQELLRSIYP